MKSQISEVRLDQLPESLRESIRKQVSDKETVLFCLLAVKKSERMCIVVTDYQLVIKNEGQFFDFNSELYTYLTSHHCSTTNWVWGLGLGSVSVSLDYEGLWKPGWKVSFDFGFKNDIGHSDPVKLNFIEDKELANRLVDVFQRAKNDDFVRSKTPARSTGDVPDIGDQLAKLAQLKKDGHLTEAEFEAAKKKLLA